MYLFFDTETTGLPNNYSAPASDVRNWPRLVQIAWLVSDDGGKELDRGDFIIRPDGFTIPKEATKRHGIDTATAKRVGHDLDKVISAFAKALVEPRVLVAHNALFDQRVVGAEFYRAGRKTNPLDSKAFLCTMQSSTSFCRIPGGSRGYKWPTLDELHRKLFGKGFAAAHNALADVQACARCFFELRKRGVFGGSGSTSALSDGGSEDQDLFDEIYSLAELCPWFDTGRFVDDVYEQFQDRGTITERQREALERVRDMLEEKAR